MRQLWAPWRLAYLANPRRGGCFLCRAARSKDRRRSWVVHRGRHAMVLLNLYPYSNGHLLVAPLKHVAAFGGLSDAATLEMLRLVDGFTERLRKRYRPDGFNVGANLGRAAGAGVPGHLHLHIVPRWIADTNFMPVLGGTKVISEALETTYRALT